MKNNGKRKSSNKVKKVKNQNKDDIYIYNDQLTSIDTKCHQKASKLSNAYSIRILPRTTCLQQHKHLKHNGLECAFPFKHGCSLGIYVKFQLGGKLSRYINCGFA